MYGVSRGSFTPVVLLPGNALVVPCSFNFPFSPDTLYMCTTEISCLVCTIVEPFLPCSEPLSLAGCATDQFSCQRDEFAKDLSPSRKVIGRLTCTAIEVGGCTKAHTG